MDRTQQDSLYSEASSAYGAELRRLARGYEANAEQQQDLLQEIHLALWKSLGSFDGRCSMRTWTFRVAHNIGASHVARSMRSARLVGLDAIPSDSIPKDAGMETPRRLSASILLELIHRLELLDRQIILLYLEGEAATSIAEVTGLSANNIATKIHRIKKLLKEQSNEGTAHAKI